LLFVQNAAIVASILAISHMKGLGSLRRDFGLAFEPRDLVWVLGGVGLAVAVGVVLIAPVAEELLFRGVLLRSLLRRVSPFTAVSVAAVVFAVVHVLGDLGTGYYVPAFLLLGL